jgi:ribosome-associated protein
MRKSAAASSATADQSDSTASANPLLKVPATLPKAVARRSPKSKTPSGPTIDVRVREAVIARLDSMKANDLTIIDVRGKTSVTDCMVIASGTSTRHVKSMGDEVVVTAKNLGLPPIGIEGELDAEWILVDLGDTVVHVMLPRTREFYGLERLWTLTEESRIAASA